MDWESRVKEVYWDDGENVVRSSRGNVEELDPGYTEYLPRRVVRCFACHDGMIRILEVDASGNPVGQRWKESIVLGKVSGRCAGRSLFTEKSSNKKSERIYSKTD